MNTKCPGCGKDYEFDPQAKKFTGCMFEQMHRNVRDEYIQEIKMFYCSDAKCECLVGIYQSSPHEGVYITANALAPNFAI